MSGEWKPFEKELFEQVIRTIAEAYGELPSGPISQDRHQFHAMMGHSLLDSAAGGDVDKALELLRRLYGEDAHLISVRPKQ